MKVAIIDYVTETLHLIEKPSEEFDIEKVFEEHKINGDNCDYLAAESIAINNHFNDAFDTTLEKMHYFK